MQNSALFTLFKP